MKRAIDIGAVIGMILIQACTVPAIIGAVWFGGTLPPLAMVLQSIIALLLLFVHSWYHGFRLYVYGNGVGLALQIITAILIGVKHGN